MVGSEIEDSNLVNQHSSGQLSPVLTDSEIEDTNMAAQQNSGDGGVKLNLQDAEIEDSNLADQKSWGDFSPNLQDVDVEDAFFTQETSGDFSPTIQDADVSNSLFNQQADGDFAFNIQNSDFEENLLINGDLKNEGIVNINGGRVGDVEIGNVAGANSTIFDGDVNLGALGFGLGLPGNGAGGGIEIEEININTGALSGSIMGQGNAIMNDTGIGINGSFGSGEAEGSVNLNNTQTVNQNVFQ